MIGMTVDVDIVIGREPDALLVPAAAVAHGPSQGGRPGAPFVFVGRRTAARGASTSKTGAVGRGEDRNRLRACADGDAVVVDPPDRLKDGQAVRVSP